MRLSQTPFSYWPIKLGFALLVLALLMSIVGLHKVPVTYSQSGILGQGSAVLGNESFENDHLYADRTLYLSSHNASMIVSWGDEKYPLNLTTNVTLKPAGRPTVNVFSGNVSYRYEVAAWEYPYSSLALPALVAMLTGTILIFVGYLRFRERG
jgi:hypothetical protein